MINPPRHSCICLDLSHRNADDCLQFRQADPSYSRKQNVRRLHGVASRTLVRLQLIRNLDGELTMRDVVFARDAKDDLPQNLISKQSV